MFKEVSEAVWDLALEPRSLFETDTVTFGTAIHGVASLKLSPEELSLSVRRKNDPPDRAAFTRLLGASPFTLSRLSGPLDISAEPVF